MTISPPAPRAGLNSLGLPGAPADCRVVVAMSGGVDSSVTAALLAREGYDVVGVTLQLYDHGVAVQKKGACCAGQDIHDARAVAARLGIPHYVLDYENRFSDAVMEEFADSYLKGETPIPCIRCNERVKFRDLFEQARDLGGMALATGHYIQRREGPHGPEMHRAVDPVRDQSYFLFATTREQLDFLRFPLGGLPKPAVREVARELGLAVADKPDSQDICFVPEGRYAAIVERLRPGAADPGEIVDLDGRVLGRHEGIINFTIGQRRGIGVAAGEPLFVVKIDPVLKQIVVGPREALKIRRVILRELNWLGEGTLDAAAAANVRVDVKLRSTRPPAPARLLRLEDGRIGVDLDEPDFGVSPGQACVFYDPVTGDSRVLGGGWIDRAEGAA